MFLNLFSCSFFTPYWLQSFPSPKLPSPKFTNLGTNTQQYKPEKKDFPQRLPLDGGTVSLQTESKLLLFQDCGMPASMASTTRATNMRLRNDFNSMKTRRSMQNLVLLKTPDEESSLEYVDS